MRLAHTVEQVRAAEADLMSRTPQGALMRTAASGLAQAVGDFLGRTYGARVLLLVGAGNNGGDALWAGALLARRGAAVEALLLAPEHTHQPGLEALRQAGGLVVDSPRATPEVVLDGIVGIGGRGGLRREAAAVVAALDGVPVVAVDVPSGVEVDSGRVEGETVRATVTVTFGTYKAAHLVDPAASRCGAVHLVDLGLDLPEPVLGALQAVDAAALLPRPEPAAHKYTRGVVGIRAGSQQYPGAGVLCVAGAATGLVGMVRYVGGAADLVHAGYPEVVVGAGRVQAWVVGSGGGEEVAGTVAEALADEVPVVLDADALSTLSGPLPVPALLTPHAGELAGLLGVQRDQVEANQLGHVRRAAERFECAVMLKGRHTIVAHPDGRVRVTTIGPPWLAVAGAGDVLAGLCGSLLASGLDPFDAGSLGSWLHGAAAGRASDGGPLRPTAVAQAIAGTCRALLG